MATFEGTFVAASFVGRQRRTIVRYFLSRHAIEARDAIDYDPGSPRAAKAFARMIEAGIIRTPGNGRFYVDRAAWRADAEARRQRGVIIAVSAAVLLAVAAMQFYRDVSISLAP